MDKLIPVLVDPPLSEGREFVCLWLNKNEEAKKPSHYFITKKQLEEVIEDSYRECLEEQPIGQAKKQILKDLGVE